MSKKALQQKIKVLLIESNPAYARIVQELLTTSSGNGIAFEIECVDRISSAVDRLSKGGIEIALSDLNLLDSDGTQTISRLHLEAPQIPIVALIGTAEKASGMVVLENGAQDYLLREQVNRELLTRAIRYAIERKQAEEALKKAHAEKELLLASITSLLIGLDEENQITYWNSITESAFNILSPDAMGKPFADCGIQWNFEMVAKGLLECRKKNMPVRVNDVQFLRPNLEEGYLGLTIIPVKSGQLDILIFGADITERKKLEHLKDEFISTVSHELRTPLTVIREGVSQVLEGILGETTDNQKKFLSIALQAIDRLSRIINDLLDISKIEADKLELKLDLVDLTTVAHEIMAPSSPYQMRAHDKGLELKARIPKNRVECYIAKDKIVQIFTNLVGNALKFTEKGSIEIIIENKGELVECRVADSGVGISKENLPRVFHKFQQFDRVAGPGEKGTGLGLAISKGLVEMHKGKIWVESQRGKGTHFVFTLPMHREKEVLKQYISSGIRKAEQHKSSFSCIKFDVSNLKELRKENSKDYVSELIENFQTSVKKSLRNKADQAVRTVSGVCVFLPSTNKEDCMHVAKRIKSDYEKLGATPLAINSQVVSFPEDGQNEDNLFDLLPLGEKP